MLTVMTGLNDDVVDEATNSLQQLLTDFLQWTLITTGVVFLLTLVVAIAVAKKAGYSGWWGAISVLVPPLGVLLLLLFAMLKWPALKERDEAIGIVEAASLTIPSRERAAIKEAQRKKAVEDEARRRMEKAQAEREAADAERARYQARQAEAAAAAAPAVEAPAEQPAPPANDSVAPEHETAPEPKPEPKSEQPPAPAPQADAPAEKPAGDEAAAEPASKAAPKASPKAATKAAPKKSTPKK